jgi:hypothetical protein
LSTDLPAVRWTTGLVARKPGALGKPKGIEAYLRYSNPNHLRPKTFRSYEIFTPEEMMEALRKAGGEALQTPNGSDGSS